MSQNIVALLAGLVLLCSCGDIVEEIHINEDGSGSYDVSFDMAEGMVGMMREMTIAMSGKEEKDLDLDSLDTAINEKIWEDFPAELDSVIDMSDRIPDSIRQDEKYTHFIEHSKMYMRGAKAKKEMRMGVDYQFKDDKDLNEYFRYLGKLDSQQGGQKGGEGLGGNPLASSDCEYIFSSKSFKRISPAQNLIKGEKKEMKEFFEKMYGKSTYTTVVHLPRDIAKVKGKGVKQKSARTVVFEYPLMDIMAGKEGGAFEVFYK